MTERSLLARLLMGTPGYDADTAPQPLQPIYSALAPDPNADYGSILPFARDKTTGEKRWAMPEMVRNGLFGALDAVAGTETGQLTDRAAQSVTLGGLGTGMALAPRNALAAGGSIRGYHGSPNNFERFDIGKSGATTDAGELGRAIYAGTDPAVAANRPHKYELNITPKNPLEISLPNFRTAKSTVIKEALGLPKTASAADIAQAALAKGYDASILDYSPTGYSHKEIAAYDPSIVDIIRKYMMGAPAPVGAPGARPSAEETDSNSVGLLARLLAQK